MTRPSRRRSAATLSFLLYLASLATSLTVANSDVNKITNNTSTTAKIVAHAEVELTSPNHECGDQHEKCREWADEGECESNPTYMLNNCSASCGGRKSNDNDNDKTNEDDEKCQPIITKATATVHNDGEDAAVGAFRFAETYHSAFDFSISFILGIARKLQLELDNRVDEYTVPKDVTHCGKRKCSAGKLWSRALELRKADVHDAAGADLIRALLRTGIETDFIEKCERELERALGSMKRQRGREEREAEEERKIEERRREEEEAMGEAERRKEEYEADFTKFGERVVEEIKVCTADSDAGGAGAGEKETEESPPRAEDGEEDDTAQESEVNEEEQKAAHQALINTLTSNVLQHFVKDGPHGSNFAETIQLIKKIPSVDKTVDVLLIEARCHEILHNPKEALSAAGRLMKKAASYEAWVNGTPRMMAATLGANAAMQLGLSKNAISFYQTVLKYDPEQDTARLQYRGLKKVVKLMDKAEEQIQKGYNMAASSFVDDCLSAMRGLDVDSPLFRSKIQLKQCTILSSMGKHEEALGNCDSAVDVRMGNDSVSSESRKEAHLVRAEALLKDMDYDEAVQDFRSAVDLVPDDDETGEKRELNHKLQSTMQQQKAWNGGQQDHRYNEHTGYPNGMPPQRDHAKILQLPIDLEERGKDIKCAWLKKQFKLLVRKFHPDKYKGNKKRAARKFQEVKDSKETLGSAWDC